MKPQLWFCSAVCMGLTYLAILGVIIFTYKDLFTPDLDLPDLTRSVHRRHNDVIQRSIKDFHFHRPRHSGSNDKDVPVLKYRTYSKVFNKGPFAPFQGRRDEMAGNVHKSYKGKTLDVLKENDLLFDRKTSGESPKNQSVQENSILAKTPHQMMAGKYYESDYDEEHKSHFHIEITVSKWNLSIVIDGNTIIREEMQLSDVKYMNKGGLYLVVLHQARGSVMHSSRHRSFEVSGDKDLLATLRNVQPGRIILLAAMSESFSNLSEETDEFLRNQGSTVINDMSAGDRWAWIWTKDGRTWAEGSVFSTHTNSVYWQGGPLYLDARPPSVGEADSRCLSWPPGDMWEARREFCDHYEGYGNLCNCHHPTMFQPTSVSPSEKMWDGIPTVVVASERPLCLHRCLSRLMEVNGSNPEMTLVVADGDPENGLREVQQLAHLYGVKYRGHDSGGNNVTIRITRHYKTVFQDGFNTFPRANKLIILEEDLYVASDFYSYFEQVAPLLERDPTLYCVSAWNDLSNTNTASDSTVVLRSETMAGLGWLLSKPIYQEIIKKWPLHNQYADWDMWMRLPDQRRGRECLVPEVPRTYHFGTIGAHLTAYFQSTYFSHTAFNTQPQVMLQGLDRLDPKGYDSLLRELITRGEHMDGSSINPCEPNLLPINATSPHVMWIKMNEWADVYTLSAVFKCLGLWDLDVRGGHKYLWRIRLRRTPLLIVGWPLSPFSVLKPRDVNILRRADPEDKGSDPPVYRILNSNDTI